MFGKHQFNFQNGREFSLMELGLIKNKIMKKIIIIGYDDSGKAIFHNYRDRKTIVIHKEVEEEFEEQLNCALTNFGAVWMK